MSTEAERLQRTQTEMIVSLQQDLAQATSERDAYKAALERIARPITFARALFINWPKVCGRLQRIARQALGLP